MSTHLLPPSRRARKLAEAQEHLRLAFCALEAVHTDNVARSQLGKQPASAMVVAKLTDQASAAYRELKAAAPANELAAV